VLEALSLALVNKGGQTLLSLLPFFFLKNLGYLDINRFRCRLKKNRMRENAMFNNNEIIKKLKTAIFFF